VSQQGTSQQSHFLLRRQRCFLGFSQQHESQQVGAQQVGAHDCVQQVGAGAQDVVQVGAQQLVSQQLTSQQLHFFWRRQRCFLGFSQQQDDSQQVGAQQSPQEAPQQAPAGAVAGAGCATGAGAGAGCAAGAGACAALTVVSSMKTTFTGVILRSYGTSAAACPARVEPSRPGKWPAPPSYPDNRCPGSVRPAPDARLLPLWIGSLSCPA
jgi:hypothetical protein